jgi:predicted dehydrogenase
MIRMAVVGLGKMGTSHLSMIKAHDKVEVVAACDSTEYFLDILNRHTGVPVYSDYSKMLDQVAMDGLILATPSAHHFEMMKKAMTRGIHVFCEKPLTLDPDQSRELATLAQEKGLVNQVGYHYRFVGTFQEVKRLLDAGAIGRVTHVLAEAYGPVVLRSKSSTWRSQRNAGGGCLYDYAAHPINLLNWYFGIPDSVGGTSIAKIFSKDTDDEVYSTLHYNGSSRLSAQLSVNWCDESQRKMTTKLTFWGTNGQIYADRQEMQVYLREPHVGSGDYRPGWNTRSTTHLTPPVWFYLRGEEYSAQLDYFVTAIAERRMENVNSFESASQTDQVIAMLLADHNATQQPVAIGASKAPARSAFSFLSPKQT